MLTIFGFALWDIAALQTKESIDASQRSGQYARDTEQQILESCVNTDLSALQTCVTEKVKASEDNQRATYDLVAQNVTARWTFGMFILALFGTFLTAFGIYFLQANLTEMQLQRGISKDAVKAAIDSSKVARDIGQKQIRAYLTCSGAAYEVNRGGFRLHPVIQNTGQSPASSIEIEGSVMSNLGMPDDVLALVKSLVAIDENYLGDGTCGVIAATKTEVGHVSWSHTEIGGDDITDILTHKSKFDVRLRIKWKDVYGDSQTVMVVLSSVDDKQNFAADLSIRAGTMSAYNQKIY